MTLKYNVSRQSIQGLLIRARVLGVLATFCCSASICYAFVFLSNLPPVDWRGTLFLSIEVVNPSNNWIVVEW